MILIYRSVRKLMISIQSEQPSMQTFQGVIIRMCLRMARLQLSREESTAMFSLMGLPKSLPGYGERKVRNSWESAVRMTHCSHCREFSACSSGPFLAKASLSPALATVHKAATARGSPARPQTIRLAGRFAWHSVSQRPCLSSLVQLMRLRPPGFTPASP